MVLAFIHFIGGSSDDRNLHQYADIIKLLFSSPLCVFLTGSAVYADTVTIAVTPGTLDAVDTVVSNDVSSLRRILIEWMEAWNIASLKSRPSLYPLQ